MTASPLAARIAREIAGRIRVGDLVAGAHLGTETIARQYRVSRSPVREALKLLCLQQVIEQVPNRGYFVAAAGAAAIDAVAMPAAATDPDQVYYDFAEDWLNDRVEGEVTEQFVRERYRLTKSQALDLLSRASREGWAEPKPGYGWRLSPVAKTTEMFEQIYRFRAVVEPAALMEPTFRLDREGCARLRERQQKLLDGAAEKLPPQILVAAGAEFHETLVRMSGNFMFVQALERANQLRRLMEYRLDVNRRRFAQQCAEHLEILGLVERGDMLEAAHLMRRHLSGALTAKAATVMLPLRSE